MTNHSMGMLRKTGQDNITQQYSEQHKSTKVQIIISCLRQDSNPQNLHSRQRSMYMYYMYISYWTCIEHRNALLVYTGLDTDSLSTFYVGPLTREDRLSQLIFKLAWVTCACVALAVESLKSEYISCV